MNEKYMYIYIYWMWLHGTQQTQDLTFGFFVVDDVVVNVVVRKKLKEWVLQKNYALLFSAVIIAHTSQS